MTTRFLTARMALCTLVAIVPLSAAWADRSLDLQAEINQQATNAGQYESAASTAESNGDKAEACRLYRNAADAWRDGARAGTSLIVETANDSNLDPDSVNENVHIMLNNSDADDARAQAVC